MTDLVTYTLDGNVAVIRMDDGKVNALSFEMFASLNSALDRAEKDAAAPVLLGREGRFSGGFDLQTLGSGGEPAGRLVQTGFELALRIFGFSAPVVVGCPGHAIAMGSFLLLSADHRIGAQGAFKLGANEVAIGLIVPRFAVELCRLRLAPTHLHRAVEQSEMFTPDQAVEAGFLDRVVPPPEVEGTAITLAKQLAALNRDVHAKTKGRVRAKGLEILRGALEEDVAEFAALMKG
jgi:enoyl-CoA hydratase